jgi:hypothetical protein
VLNAFDWFQSGNHKNDWTTTDPKPASKVGLVCLRSEQLRFDPLQDHLARFGPRSKGDCLTPQELAHKDHSASPLQQPADGPVKPRIETSTVGYGEIPVNIVTSQLCHERFTGGGTRKQPAATAGVREMAVNQVDVLAPDNLAGEKLDPSRPVAASNC